MNLPIFIARRYLFSKKKQNAINVISFISVMGVAVGTAALIIVLSVFNGIDGILTSALNHFTSDLIITPTKGKFFQIDTSLTQILRQTPELLSYNEVLEERTLVKYKKKLLPVILKGVKQEYGEHMGMQQAIVLGRFLLKEDEKFMASVGSGIAATLKLHLGTTIPLVFYYPNKHAIATASALNIEQMYPISVFSSQQEIDGKYIISDIEFARSLFMAPTQVSQIEIKLKDSEQIASVKEQLSKEIPSIYKIEDKYDANASFYAMMRSEKLAIFIILLFILFIASFNIVGSVSMLILDKKDNIHVFQSLGMNERQIISIFKLEGNFITWMGAFIGVCAGSILCLLQEYFGLITLGDGSYIIEAYPVKMIGRDVFACLIAVGAIGFIASYFPVRYLVHKIIKQ